MHAVTCPDCNGTRLNSKALSVKVHEKSIAEIGSFELNELKTWIQSNSWGTIAQDIKLFNLELVYALMLKKNYQ